VAKITGLSLDTLRAWERRYQAVVPERSERGRQYGPAHIERLMLLNRLVQNGHAIGQIAGLPDLELQNLLAPETASTAGPAPLDLLGPVFSAIETFDSARAGDELSRLAAVLSPRDLVYQVAIPLMRETGSRWHDGTFAIAQEHMVSQLLRNLLGSMMRLYRRAGSGPKVIFATPAGDSHELGVLAAAMLSAIAGLEPVYLGSHLPALEIARAAERAAARIVAIGVAYPAPGVSDEVRILADALPGDVEFWVGGDDGNQLDLSGIRRDMIRIKDLYAFENECRRWRN
jgi:DNA-binding transcriptional MerR regulator